MKHLPHSTECERAALGCVILDSSILPKMELSPEDFYHEKYRKIFSAMKALYENNQPIDLVTLPTKLGKDVEVIGIPTILELTDSAGGSANFIHYCNVIKEKRRLRDIIALSASLNNKCLDDPNKETITSLLATIQNQLSEMSKEKTTSSGLLETFIKGQVEHTEAIINGTIVDNTIKTGFPDLDKNIAGFRPGNLDIVAGRPGSGKTAISLDFALNVIRRGHTAAYFTLEMTTIEISQRLICKIANVGLKSLINGLLTTDELERVREAANKPYIKNLFISEENIMPSQIEQFIDSWNLANESPMRVVFIDHLQLAGLHDGKSYERRDLQIARYTSQLKDIAKRKGVCIVLLSQLNRNLDARNKGERLPKLSDLRDSGSIEQDADVVLAVYRKGLETLEEADQDSGVLLVLKNRNGQVGVIDLEWVGSRATYRSKVRQNPPVKLVKKPKTTVNKEPEPQGPRFIDPDTGMEIRLDVV